MHALQFHERAEKEWFELDKGIRERPLKVLERRLVYEVFDNPPVVLVVAVGGRGKQDVYRTAASRID